MTFFWIVFALMTAAAVLAVLWPLSRRGPAGGGSDVAVYRDQLDEIARDRAADLIGEAEAQAAKIEVSRRLLAAAENAEITEARVEPASSDRSSLRRRRIAAVAALVLVPAGAIALYSAIGSPDMPGESLAARLSPSHQNKPIAELIAQVEMHLQRNPNDIRGWEVLAPVYLRLGRVDDAARASRKIIDLGGETAEREANLGEALTAAANGVVTKEAKDDFEHAVKLDDKEMKAQFFLGVAAAQDGRNDKAAGIWRGMLAKGPPDAPWIATVQHALASIGQPVAPATASAQPPAAGLSAPAPGPNAAEVAAASKMSAQDRSAMIHRMVARLAERLKTNGGDVEGWQRLVRAYMVLGEREKAKSAAAEARKAVAGDQDKLRRIDDMVKSLGLQS